MNSPVVETRLHRRDAHVGGQRGLELREELRPRERALVDDAVGFARRVGDDLQLLRVDLRADRAPPRRAAAPPPAPPRAALAPSVRWLDDQPHDLDDVEQRDAERRWPPATPSATLHRAHVVERAGREVRAQHQARHRLPPRPQQHADQRRQDVHQLGRRRDPIGQRAARVGSIGSTRAPSRSSRLRRATSTRPARVPLPPSSTRAKPCPPADPGSTSPSGARRRRAARPRPRRGCGRRSRSSPRMIASEVYSGRMCTTSQSPAGASRDARNRFTHAQRGQIDEPGVDARLVADAFVFARRRRGAPARRRTRCRRPLRAPGV